MNDIEQRARELLCGECDMDPSDYYDEMPVKGDEALRAIVAALSQQLAVPEGFVLVPVEPTSDMEWAATDIEVGYSSWAGSRDCCTTGEASAIWSAMIAGRPEVL